VRGVIERARVAAEFHRIRLPTLILVGDEDVATVPAKSEAMQAGIPGARLVRIPRAGHTSTLESPAAVNAALREFLDAP
jgi:pimeloyl-ACP methyl ester carboxylesterase